MRAVTLILLVVVLAGCTGPFQVRRTKWTVDELKSWYAEYVRTEPGVRGIAYQGTDQNYHHYIARVRSVDNWAIIAVRKEDLKVPEELPYSLASSAPFAHYYVDPGRDFARLPETE